MSTSCTVSLTEKSLFIRTHITFSKKARLYINVVLEDFVHMSSMLSVIQPEGRAVAELCLLNPARLEGMAGSVMKG
jgi:hypothetical protein